MEERLEDHRSLIVDGHADLERGTHQERLACVPLQVEAVTALAEHVREYDRMAVFPLRVFFGTALPDPTLDDAVLKVIEMNHLVGADRLDVVVLA